MAQDTTPDRRFENSQCTECSGKISVDDRTVDVEKDEVRYNVSCDDCPESGTILMDSNGTVATGSVKYRTAADADEQ